MNDTLTNEKINFAQKSCVYEISLMKFLKNRNMSRKIRGPLTFLMFV